MFLSDKSFVFVCTESVEHIECQGRAGDAHHELGRGSHRASGPSLEASGGGGVQTFLWIQGYLGVFRGIFSTFPGACSGSKKRKEKSALKT